MRSRVQAVIHKKTGPKPAAFAANTGPVALRVDLKQSNLAYIQQWVLWPMCMCGNLCYLQAVMCGSYLGASKKGPQNTLKNGIEVISTPMDNPSNFQMWELRPAGDEAPGYTRHEQNPESCNTLGAMMTYV